MPDYDPLRPKERENRYLSTLSRYLPMVQCEGSEVNFRDARRVVIRANCFLITIRRLLKPPLTTFTRRTAAATVTLFHQRLLLLRHYGKRATDVTLTRSESVASNSERVRRGTTLFKLLTSTLFWVDRYSVAVNSWVSSWKFWDWRTIGLRSCIKFASGSTLQLDSSRLPHIPTLLPASISGSLCL